MMVGLLLVLFFIMTHKKNRRKTVYNEINIKGEKSGTWNDNYHIRNLGVESMSKKSVFFWNSWRHRIYDF